jgi:hypothetical protein
MDLFNSLSHNTQDYRDQLNQQRLNQRGQQAGLEREVGQAYTPNQATNAYMDTLNQLVQANESRRYRTPVSTTTGRFAPGWFDTLGLAGTGMKLGDSISRYIEHLRQKGSSGDLGVVPEEVTWKV